MKPPKSPPSPPGEQPAELSPSSAATRLDGALVRSPGEPEAAEPGPSSTFLARSGEASGASAENQGGRTEPPSGFKPDEATRSKIPRPRKQRGKASTKPTEAERQTEAQGPGEERSESKALARAWTGSNGSPSLPSDPGSASGSGRAVTLRKLDLVLGLLETGQSQRRACAAAGLGRATFHRLRESKRHGPRIERALELGLAALEASIEEAATHGHDWRAAQALLQVRDPAAWSAKAQVAIALQAAEQPAPAPRPEHDLSLYSAFELDVISAIQHAAASRTETPGPEPQLPIGHPERLGREKFLENIRAGRWPRFHHQPAGSLPAASEGVEQ